jgi:hypothetical protein
MLLGGVFSSNVIGKFSGNYLTSNFHYFLMFHVFGDTGSVDKDITLYMQCVGVRTSVMSSHLSTLKVKFSVIKSFIVSLFINLYS